MNNVAETFYCANHPTVATTLRCNRCEKPICSKCAVLTPTGYRCKECVRGQQKVFETAYWYDYVFGCIAAAVLSGLAAFGIWLLPWQFLTIFFAPAIGIAIAEVVRLIVHRRRSKRLHQLVAVAAVVGTVPILINLLFAFTWYALIWQGVYLALAIPAIYYRLHGIRV